MGLSLRLHPDADQMLPRCHAAQEHDGGREALQQGGSHPRQSKHASACENIIHAAITQFINITYNDL